MWAFISILAVMYEFNSQSVYTNSASGSKWTRGHEKYLRGLYVCFFSFEMYSHESTMKKNPILKD